MLNELNVQSVVTAPAHDEMIALTAQGTYTVKGFAYSGLISTLIALLQFVALLQLKLCCTALDCNARKVASVKPHISAS